MDMHNIIQKYLTRSDAARSSAIPFIKRISVRVTFIILVILILGIGGTVYYYSIAQNTAIITSREDAIRDQGEILYRSIKNNMLAGEAPIAVDLFRDLSRSGSVSEIRLFRAGGVSAFSDNSTLRTVNKNLDDEQFEPKTVFAPKVVISDPNFTRSVNEIDNIFVKDVEGAGKRLVIFRPLINQPRCSQCHGTDHVIRGVIMIASPVDDLYLRTRNNLLLSIAIFGFAVMVLSLSIVLFLRRIVIGRVSLIGRVVEGVGAGDFKTRIPATGSDEIGTLTRQINGMIEGLDERFKLEKFVSRATLEHVKTSDVLALGGEKKEVTVLFSDIRKFTTFSENRDPAEVMQTLNEVMNLQTEAVQLHGGDIDKFIGDALIATFEGPDMELRAARAALEIRERLKERSSGPDDRIYVGIGINTGEVISGNMGSGRRMERTVIGDAVNIGSRLCSIAGRNTIIISESSHARLKGRITVTGHGAIPIRGRAKPVKIFTLRGLS